MTETECSERCVDFLKETMFNYNNGEITLAALGNDNLPPSEQVVMESMRLLSNV